MAVTTEHFYSGNNSTTTFAYTFPYYKTSDIKVEVGGTLKTEATHYNVTGTNIVFTSGNVPPNGTNNIHIYRDTDVDTSKATFAAGSSIRATDLNNNNLQLLYHAQEHDNTIQTGNIATAEGKGQLVNANISATAAIDGTKISPNFGAQNIVTSGTVDGRDVSTDGTKLDGIEAGATGDQTNAEIRAAVEAATDSNVFTDADHSKLNAVEAGATGDQTAAEIRSLVGDATDSNVFRDADHSKLDAIEASATADQTGAEIKAAYEGESNTNAYTDSEKTKLAGIPADATGNQTSTDIKTLLASDKITGDHITDYSIPNSKIVQGSLTGSEHASGFLNNANYITAGGSTGADKVLVYDASETTNWKWADQDGGGAAITIQEEGSSLSTAAEIINFVGANVTASGTGTTKTITISGGGEVTVQDEGSALSTSATTLNFVGAGVTASGTGATKTITISGSGGSPITTDYQYLELKAHNNASGAFSAGSADYELVTKGTSTAVSPDQAAAMLISIAGVLQEPNTGTSIGSNDGFCIDGSSIHFGANLAAHPDYIIWMKGSGSHTIDANSITNAKIADDTIAEAKLDIHNAPSGTDKYLKYTSNGMEWATAGSGTPEGTAILSTGESGGTKFLREDGDGTCSWQAAGSGTPEGTVILSTGESGTAKFLRVDGDGSCSWQVPPDTNTQISIDDTPVDGVTNEAISSNWAYDHNAATGNGAHVPAAGSSGQFLKHDGTWGTPPDNNTVYTHPNHSGEVTSTADGATVITDDIVDEANLKVSNAPTNGYVLTARSGNTGGMTWEEASGGGISSSILEHVAALTANHTITTGNNGLVAGPFSTGTYTLTIPSGSVFTVV